MFRIRTLFQVTGTGERAFSKPLVEAKSSRKIKYVNQIKKEEKVYCIQQAAWKT